MRLREEVQALPRSDRVGASEGLAAGVFYVALALTVGGAVVLARGAVERRTTGNRLGFVLLGIGLAGIVV
ncbi:MAG: hypothetical protein IAI49_10680, partial [Candidatus Eremiobacteraeota bacterium]|nr:hypothetical protein [Candidatus Eremiobacteraeota bacterium]